MRYWCFIVFYSYSRNQFPPSSGALTLSHLVVMVSLHELLSTHCDVCVLLRCVTTFNISQHSQDYPILSSDYVLAAVNINIEPIVFCGLTLCSLLKLTDDLVKRAASITTKEVIP
jgi:hypothetical protein